MLVRSDILASVIHATVLTCSITKDDSCGRGGKGNFRERQRRRTRGSPASTGHRRRHQEVIDGLGGGFLSLSRIGNRSQRFSLPWPSHSPFIQGTITTLVRNQRRISVQSVGLGSGAVEGPPVSRLDVGELGDGKQWQKWTWASGAGHIWQSTSTKASHSHPRLIADEWCSVTEGKVSQSILEVRHKLFLSVGLTPKWMFSSASQLASYLLIYLHSPYSRPRSDGRSWLQNTSPSIEAMGLLSTRRHPLVPSCSN